MGASENMASLSFGNTCVSVSSYQATDVTELVCDFNEGTVSRGVRGVKETKKLM